jgi:hypothetical protein
MLKSQYLNFIKASHRVSGTSRLLAGLVFLAGLGTAGLLHWAAINDLINMDHLIGPCGFKQKYGLPCPGCGMTTALIAFARGDIVDAFYIQPAAALAYSAAVAAVVFALVIAVLGTDFGLINALCTQLKASYVIFAIVVIVFGGWLVTLARALAQKTP